ncbi:hypothetical protein MIND_01276200 [Mycena indigotica]|uniref:DUF6533 domain-containing protein n=1 Tax=Mycena indigotica TaxID=2126181 RepID=A0A8H6S1Q9_9AGAR|nr:uncharacterized protein MIND_01276200 [Mycena indigotica]KAF7291319.1 hypothetical protein MIND_01276200 [Mycena indigotica]
MAMDDETEVLKVRLIPSTLVACCTILVYDWLLTLHREVAAIWSHPRSIGTVIFLVNRYLPFVDVWISTTTRFQHVSPEACLVRNRIVGWMSLIGVCISEAILMLRTYAIWGRSRSVMIILCVVWVATVIPGLIITQFELTTLIYTPTANVGCNLVQAGTIIIYAYVLLMISETAVVVLTALRAYRDLRNRSLHRSWITQLYKDGMLFYIYLLAISIANVLVPILGPEYMANWLASLQRVLHSVLTTRVLLLIRSQLAASQRFAQLDSRGEELESGTYGGDATYDSGSSGSRTLGVGSGLAFVDMSRVRSGMSEDATGDCHEP